MRMRFPTICPSLLRVNAKTSGIPFCFASAMMDDDIVQTPLRLDAFDVRRHHHSLGALELHRLRHLPKSKTRRRRIFALTGSLKYALS